MAAYRTQHQPSSAPPSLVIAGRAATTGPAKILKKFKAGPILASCRRAPHIYAFRWRPLRPITVSNSPGLPPVDGPRRHPALQPRQQPALAAPVAVGRRQPTNAAYRSPPLPRQIPLLFTRCAWASQSHPLSSVVVAEGPGRNLYPSLLPRESPSNEFASGWRPFCFSECLEVSCCLASPSLIGGSQAPTRPADPPRQSDACRASPPRLGNGRIEFALVSHLCLAKECSEDV